MTMSTSFPKACKLSESEKGALREFLEPGESPCEGCGISSICDGPEEARKEESALFDNPTGKCIICGTSTGDPKESKLISGTFHRCLEHEGEYVFSPLEAVPESHAESVDF